MRLVWQPQEQKWTQPIAYCEANPCTCGQGCRDNLSLHRQITGALQSDERTDERPLVLPEEIDDSIFEAAMATLGAK